MSNLLKIAIVGCGRVAGHHVRAIGNNPNLRLIAICDIKEDRLTSLKGVDRIPAYVNYHDMLRRHPETDVVAIITPSGMHFEHAMDMVKQYGKSVVIEKPVVMRVTQGEELARASSESGVHVFPVHQYRFNRCVQRIRNAIIQNELGPLVLASVRMRWCRPQSYYDRDPWRGTFALDGGCCTNQGIHHLDMLRYFIGEVKRVNAIMSTRGVEIEVEDTVVANVEFENGTLGVIEITTAARPRDFESSLSVIGLKGLAMLGGWATDKLVTFSPKPEDEQTYSDTFADAYGIGHNDIYAGVYETIVNGGKPAVEFSDAMLTIRFLQAVYLSNERKQWIDLASNDESQCLGRYDEALTQLYRTPKL